MKTTTSASIRNLRKRFYKKTGGPRGWGNRCKEYYPGCLLCELYRFNDMHGRFPSHDELQVAVMRAQDEFENPTQPKESEDVPPSKDQGADRPA